MGTDFLAMFLNGGKRSEFPGVYHQGMSYS